MLRFHGFSRFAFYFLNVFLGIVAFAPNTDTCLLLSVSSSVFINRINRQWGHEFEINAYSAYYKQEKKYTVRRAYSVVCIKYSVIRTVTMFGSAAPLNGFDISWPRVRPRWTRTCHTHSRESALSAIRCRTCRWWRNSLKSCLNSSKCVALHLIPDHQTQVFNGIHDRIKLSFLQDQTN